MIIIRASQAIAVSIAIAACAQNSGLLDTSALLDRSGLLPSETPGGVTVSGRVTTSDGTPIFDAGVSIPGATETTRTDANGSYTLANVAPGPSAVIVSRTGYATARSEAKFSIKSRDRGRNQIDVTLLTPDETADLFARSVRDSTILERVGFLQRQASVRSAYFVTPEEIAQISPRTLADVFRHVPVMLDLSEAPGSRYRGQGCFITYVNGIVRRGTYTANLETFVPAKEVVAAEVYPPGQTPPAPFNRVGSRSNCTSVGIWTRI